MTSTQRRGRRIAMTETERDAYLRDQRTCRVATIGPAGPHVSPLWFLWSGGEMWLNSIVSSQRWRDLARDSRVAVVVDDGASYGELRGVELSGRAEPVGEVPRTGMPDPVLAPIELAFHTKYRDPADPIPFDGRHGWLRLRPERLVSWDFTKIAEREGKNR